jgi:hypothetical protein
MSDMDIAVGLGRETGSDTPLVFSRPEVVVYDIPDKIGWV